MEKPEVREMKQKLCGLHRAASAEVGAGSKGPQAAQSPEHSVFRNWIYFVFLRRCKEVIYTRARWAARIYDCCFLRFRELVSSETGLSDGTCYLTE